MHLCRNVKVGLVWRSFSQAWFARFWVDCWSGQAAHNIPPCEIQDGVSGLVCSLVVLGIAILLLPGRADDEYTVPHAPRECLAEHDWAG